MSFHRKNNYSNNWRGGRQDHRDRSRSREKQRNYNNHSHDKYNHYGNRNQSKWNKKYNQQDKETIVREIYPCQVEDPKEFIIGQNVSFEEGKNKFVVEVEKGENPPQKNENLVHELKNKITPIQKRWTYYIKQYLNDSEFVEIFRKNKSLSEGRIQYGKSIINYRDAIMEDGDYKNEKSQSQVFSRAYFKLWEILAMGVFDGKQKQPLNIASVAEGPGGFIHAMIDFRQKQTRVKDDFYSITLRIDGNTRNAKDWSDGRGKSYFEQMRWLGYEIRLSYGKNKTGDLLLEENIDYFANDDLKNRKCFLVTGDGGIQCIGDKEFDYQEVFNVKLFLGEILCALKVQEIGGKFILKVYDCSFQITKQLLTLLSVFYDRVRMIKPITSRPGNSQKYMLCEGFRGMTKEQETELKGLLKEWITIEPDLNYFENAQFVQSILKFPHMQNHQQVADNLQKADKYFLDEQASKLKQGLELDEAHHGDTAEIEASLNRSRYQQQMNYAYAWCKKYGIATIDIEYKAKIE